MSPAVLDLPANLDSTAASALAADFTRNLGSPLQVRGGQVARLSTPCLQVLLAAARTWREAGCAFHLEEVSPPLREALELLGLSPDLTPGEAMTP
jgi:chemotaxis protein CheX